MQRYGGPEYEAHANTRRPNDGAAELAQLLSALFDPDDPFEALITASDLASMTERYGSPLRPAQSRPGIRGTADVLFEANVRPADVLLLVWDELVDPSPISKLRKRQIQRRTKTPAWLAQLPDAKPSAATCIGPMTGETRMVSVEVATSFGPLFVSVSILYSGMPMIEDGLARPGTVESPADGVEEIWGEHVIVSDIPLADARAEIEDALDVTDLYVDAPVTQTWPVCRPLLRWVLRQLPEGGAGHDYPEYDEEQMEADVNAFMTSPYSAGLGKHAADHAWFLLDLACNYGSGNIYGWSEHLAERVLLDLAPRKMLAGEDYMRGMPQTLAALVRFSHNKIGVPESLTQEVLEEISRNKREFNRLIKPNRYEPDFDSFGFEASWVLDIGGRDALDGVNVEPLPAERLNTKGMSREVGTRARAVGKVIEEKAPGFFQDPEMTTSALRIFERLCRESPDYLISKSTTSSAGPVSWETNVAAAVCWLTGKVNGWFTQSNPSRTVKALTGEFGLKTSPATRGDTIARRLPTAQMDRDGWHIGDPALLTSTKREAVLHEVAQAGGPEEGYFQY